MINCRIILTIFLTLSLCACATVEDVRCASDLIRLDNELTRVLTSVKGRDGGTVLLQGIASDALAEAEKVKASQNKIDAISFYRIAATAYWQSDSPGSSDRLMAAVEEGEAICTELKENAPDRDCIYLKLVVPFAGIESASFGRNHDKELQTVTFTDGSSKKKVDILDDAAIYLRTIKSATTKIIGYGSDPVLVHPH